jgi:dipeptidyl-peptidase 4
MELHNSNNDHNDDNAVQQQQHYAQVDAILSPELVAQVPPPGLGGPSQISFSPDDHRIAYLSTIQTKTGVGASSSNHSRHHGHHHHHHRTATYRPLTIDFHGNGGNNNNDATLPQQQVQQQRQQNGGPQHQSPRHRNNNISGAIHSSSSSSSAASAGGPKHHNHAGNNNTTSASTTATTTTTTERILMCFDLQTRQTQCLLHWASPNHKKRRNAHAAAAAHNNNNMNIDGSSSDGGGGANHNNHGHNNHHNHYNNTNNNLSLEERLRRERQRASTHSLTTFSWMPNDRLLIPARGSLFVQDGIGEHGTATCIHDKTVSNIMALDAQVAPNGQAVAWTADRNLHVQYYDPDQQQWGPGVRVTDNGHVPGLSHGVADFVAQEEMDRYQGFWWHPDSSCLLVCQNDETEVPVVRILHHSNSSVVASSSSMSGGAGGGGDNGSSSQTTMDQLTVGGGATLPGNDTTIGHSSNNTNSGHVYEDHRYPFAGKMNPTVRLGWLPLPSPDTVLSEMPPIRFLDPPREATEYLARVHWVHDSAAVAQWQNRSQTVTVLQRITKTTCRTLLVCRSDVWINLHHIFHVLEKPVHPSQVDAPTNGFIPRMPDPLPEGSFSFLFANERTGFQHVYLYTYCPGVNNEQAVELRAVTSGNWMVESINGVDQASNQIFFTGTYDSCLERHLYTTTLLGPATPLHRLTLEAGMHSITMDSKCRVYVDTSSDIDRPTTVKVYEIQSSAQSLSPPRHIHTLYNAATEEDANLIACLTPPQLIHFPTADGTETLYAAVYPPDPRKHGPGPYPLVCAVYGGPHVQRVNRSWSQSADMRAQRLRNLGFCVVKCDNRGSSRRGLAFESAIAKRLGRLEVLDQVSAVRQLILRGIVDASRVGVYGWSYGGYLAAMCLCRAPDVFHVAVAGAPVTSWDGYDTHYTERYMGLPADNPSGYRESAVFDHVPNMRGNLMIVHGLIDENVHFRHTSRLINKLIAAGKEYDLLIFPEERHSPRRLRDRIYMEQRISEYFLKHLVRNAPATALDLMTASLNGSIANNNNNGKSHGASKNGNSLRPPSHL